MPRRNPSSPLSEGPLSVGAVVYEKITVAKRERLERTNRELLEWHREIVNLAIGWDEDGALGPKQPLDWETIARMAMDYSLTALRASGQPPITEVERQAFNTADAIDRRQAAIAKAKEQP